MKTLKVFTDGASRGNPGPAGIGVVIIDGNKKIEISQLIGITTNNVAEYKAVIAALKKAIELQGDSVELYSDSELLVRQLNGIYKVRDKALLRLWQEIKALLKKFKTCTITHIPRQENYLADKLAREALVIRKNISYNNTPIRKEGHGRP